jgi:hypothetical protein
MTCAEVGASGSNLSMREPNQLVMRIYFSRMAISLRCTIIPHIRPGDDRAANSGNPMMRDGAAHREEVRNGRVFRFVCLARVVRDLPAGARHRPIRPTLAPADILSVRPVPARAALHARAWSEVAREARARRCRPVGRRPADKYFPSPGVDATRREGPQALRRLRSNCWWLIASSRSIELNAIAGRELVDVPNRDRRRLGRRARIVRCRKRRHLQKSLEAGRREHQQIVIFNEAQAARTSDAAGRRSLLSASRERRKKPASAASCRGR